MSGMISGGSNPLGTPGTSPSQNDLASLIQAGQQFAQQMQQQNPELIEQLRSQIRVGRPAPATTTSRSDAARSRCDRVLPWLTGSLWLSAVSSCWTA